MFFLVSVKTPAKSVWWAAWLGPRRGPWRRPIWGPRCRRHRVQTNSHGNPGCGTPFSVSPRGPSLPPGSPPAPSWHRSGSYPSNWQEKTQRALTTQAYDCSGRLVLNWMHHLVKRQSQEWKSSQNLAPQKTQRGKSLWRHSRWSLYSSKTTTKEVWSRRLFHEDWAERQIRETKYWDTEEGSFPGSYSAIKNINMSFYWLIPIF